MTRFTATIGGGRQRGPNLCLAIVALAAVAHTRADDAKPNFVVIFTDDQGYQDVGCFGSPDIQTPRLDQMAAEGMKFTSFYAQPICGPSRAALMTGCYPLRVAERGNVKQVHPILHSDEITVAEVLKTQGYATACFGKWDLAKHAQTGFFLDLFPTRQGFDYFYGTPTSNDRVVDLYRDEELIEPATDMATLTRRYTDEAVRFVEQHANEPFFVYIPHTMPHTRLDASPRFKGKSKRGPYGRRHRGDRLQCRPRSRHDSTTQDRREDICSVHQRQRALADQEQEPLRRPSPGRSRRFSRAAAQR